MKKKVLMTGFILIVAVAMIAGATMAWFTAEDNAGEAVFTAGTLVVDVSDGLTAFDLSDAVKNMNPGDVYDEIEIIIENTGTKKLAWFGNWIISGGENTNEADANLQEAIYIHSMKMEFLSPEDGDDWETADLFIDDGVGAGSYPGWFNTLAASSKFGVVSLDVWDDNNGMGTTPYEHMGALKPGYMYKLTVKFGFHQNADNDYQGNVTNPVDVGFEVVSTQITEGRLMLSNLDLVRIIKHGWRHK